MSTALIVFAKAPVAGLAKTRLIPALGAAGAAALAERLLVHAVEAAVAAGFEHGGAVHHARHRATRCSPRWRRQHGLALRGARRRRPRRAHAACAGARAAAHERALLIGSDAAGARRRRACARPLRRWPTHDAVFVPALDGGYALVGLRRPAPQLFEGMAWSTPQVMAAHARARCARPACAVAELPRAARHRRAGRPGAPAAGWLR